MFRNILNSGGGFFAAGLLVVLAGSLLPCPALATFHVINVNEVYTNGDGTVQFVELIALLDGQTVLGPTRLVAYNADSTAEIVLIDLTANFPDLNINETLLFATPAFQDSAGFAPDFVIPANVFFPDGRVAFNRDPGQGVPVVIDGVGYGNYTGPNTGYGTPAAALPTDASHSLKRVAWGISGRNNSVDFRVSVNNPKRNDGTTTTLHANASSVDPGILPGRIALLQNRPNPARGETTVPFALDREADVTLSVYSVSGELVARVPAGRLGPGTHEVSWSGLDASGRPAAAGVYFYSIAAGTLSASRSMILVR